MYDCTQDHTELAECMRTFKTEGFIIKRRNSGEADRILTIFSRQYGKIQAKAPGVRKITSRRSSHIELLNLSVLTLYKSSRSSLSIVTEANTLENFSSLKGDLKKIGFSFYMCELLNNLCAENQENNKVFYLLKNTLTNLENFSLYDSILDEFEERLLAILGYTSKFYPVENRKSFIEGILEKKLRARDMIPLFIS